MCDRIGRVGFAGVAQRLLAAARAGVQLRAFAYDYATRLTAADAAPLERPQLRRGGGIFRAGCVGKLFNLKGKGSKREITARA